MMTCRYTILCVLSLFLILTQFSTLKAQVKPFFPNGTYNTDIPTPAEFLGFELGARPVQHLEVVRYFKKLAELSPRAKYYEAGKTHENRLLGYLVVTAEKNMNNLKAIRKQHASLADPRLPNNHDIEKMPAVAWMMYSIHGNELSGTDASVQLAYQLTAGTDALTMGILNGLIVGIDPMENPDGRERRTTQLQQWQRNEPNSDVQDISHSGIWPSGRGNHYLFDLNRDWFILAHPETRSRVKAINEWSPQLVVDAHEMGSYDTYLFNPPREPINLNVGQNVRKWWEIFSQDQAQAFDDFGWSYYTREWYDDLYPGYGSALPNFSGTIGILYEQARTDGSLIKKPNDNISTFRDAVHRQFISSMANLKTAAENRVELLKDFHAVRKEAIQIRGAYYIVPDENSSRVDHLVERMLLSGFEVHKTKASFKIKNAHFSSPPVLSRLDIPANSYVIPLNQPLGFLIKAVLEFDPRMLTSVLQKEFEDLEKGKGTHLYDVTAWSMLLAYDVKAYYSESAYPKNTERIKLIEKNGGVFQHQQGAAAFLCEYDDDNAIRALLEMYENDIKVRIAKKPFAADGKNYDRGTLLIRANENGDGLTKQLEEIATNTGVDITGIKSMRIQTGPDLGGREFQLLEKPRIAILTGTGLSSYNIGATWYLLEYELNTRFSMLNHESFSRYDLRKYNVLILPSSWGGSRTYHHILGKEGIAKLKDWVKDGGTLIGIDGGAVFLADSSSKMSRVKLKRQALKELPSYAVALEKEKHALMNVDSLAIWEGKVQAVDEEDEGKKKELEALEKIDEHQRIYRPRGVILKVNLDEENWINYGMRNSVPAMFSSSYAFMSKYPLQTAGRFAESNELRLSGLVWPEAKERWANTAYVTRESSGKGQIILFAAEPNFRSYFYGTTRMLLNSMLLGPGMGTSVVVDY
ncbi:MAG: hypothetical protein IIA45_02595 [Bacteroidetes bacterium]|nr:hypothetical protein [Bacteroidota bacterium]